MVVSIVHPEGPDKQAMLINQLTSVPHIYHTLWGSKRVWDLESSLNLNPESLTCCVTLFSPSVVSDSFSTPCTVAPPGSSVHGIFQARILEWVSFPFPGIFWTRGSNLGPWNWQVDSLPLSHEGCEKQINTSSAWHRVGTHLYLLPTPLFYVYHCFRY